MNVAVVGGGVFGCVIATDLARAGARVDLFERHHELLSGATRTCQARLHRGYHYPRSTRTANEASASFDAFNRRFPESVIKQYKHHYLIARDCSLTDTTAYTAFMRRQHLPYTPSVSPLVRSDTVDTCVRVPEAFVDVHALRAHLRHDLASAGVAVYVNAPVDLRMETWTEHDRVVNATYGTNMPYPVRFELCEVVLVRLGPRYTGQSFVVMDGAFVSLDPIPGHDLHMLYDVDRSVHHVSATGEVPHAYRNMVDAGVVDAASVTRVDGMAYNAGRFLKDFPAYPDYRGSLFTVRAVLPNVDATDERPTLVHTEGKLTHVLSGKIGTAVLASRRIVEHVVGVKSAA
jgi:hypothetical protein